MTQAQITRTFAADPASVALLLSGPAADELWGEPADDRTGDHGPVVQAGPPMRSGIGFVVDLTIADPELGSARGRLALSHSAGETLLGGTDARLVLTSARASATTLRRRGEHFLDALSSLAVARSSAA
jgi:hypothetical protein